MSARKKCVSPAQRLAIAERRMHDWAAVRGVLASVALIFERAHRLGSDVDQPEGARFIQISDTLANRVSCQVRELLSRADSHLDHMATEGLS